MRRPDSHFMDEARSLEEAYLESPDPIRRSGFGGGQTRWETERAPLIEAIDHDGSFLDVGCANGLLAADVVRWAAAKGFTVEPHGIDLGARLIGLARRRHPAHASNFETADAWTWQPRRTWTYVYSLLDLAPLDLAAEWLHLVRGWVGTEGRLIVGSYGSMSRARPPEDVGAVMTAAGLEVEGVAIGGHPPVTSFAWTARRRADGRDWDHSGRS